jgi:hypothetical protein
LLARSSRPAAALLLPSPVCFSAAAAAAAACAVGCRRQDPDPEEGDWMRRASQGRGGGEPMRENSGVESGAADALRSHAALTAATTRSPGRGREGGRKRRGKKMERTEGGVPVQLLAPHAAGGVTQNQDRQGVRVRQATDRPSPGQAAVLCGSNCWPAHADMRGWFGLETCHLFAENYCLRKEKKL